jgi:hypothetical protein
LEVLSDGSIITNGNSQVITREKSVDISDDMILTWNGEKKCVEGGFGPVSRLNKVLVDNITIDTFAQDGENDWYVSVENPFEAFAEINEEGRQFKVIFDGVEYICKSLKQTVNDYDWQCIGNPAIINQIPKLTIDSSIPFAICQDFYKNAGEIQVFVKGDSSSSHTISIIDITATTIPLDDLYLPERLSEKLIRKGTGNYSLSLGFAGVASGTASVAIGN